MRRNFRPQPEISWEYIGLSHSARPATSRDRGKLARAAASPLRKPAGLVELEARRARKQCRGIADAEIDQEIRLDARAGEERLIDDLVVEAGHRPGIDPEHARGDEEVGPLQGAVAEGGLMRKLGAA